jgi:hypothetical protein
VVAGGAVVVVAGGGNRFMKQKEKVMNSEAAMFAKWRSLHILLLVALLYAVGASAWATGQVSQAQASPQSAQKSFGTPQAAAEALIQAAKTYDVGALKDILGPEGDDLVSSEDPVQDKSRAAAFAAKAEEKNQVTVDPKNPKRATLSVGDDDWPLPIPIAKTGTAWIFDTKAGRQEVLFRRIGSNELDAIQICRGYVDAQYEYASEKHDGSEVNQYAQRIISTPGKRDGLAWRNADGTLEGPVAQGIAKALEQGYTNRGQPYHGYFFKILKGQGPAAPLGQMDFVVNKAMIGGFAMAAAPAEYRVTGVKTFIVSYEGIVYQKDLGPNTLATFKDMELYNPDKTWQRTDDNW